MKFKIDYKTLERDTLDLVGQIERSKISLDTLQLVCISRGGLFVGGLLSYALNLKDVYCVSLESYKEDMSNNSIKCRTPFLPEVDRNKTYLFVDDINDTSQTYRFVKQKCEEQGLMNYFATVYHKTRKSNLLPDFYSKEVDEKLWVEFPWDNL